MTAAPDHAPLLTPRQLEVLELLAKGLTNAEIAGVLGISPGTAKVHVSRVISALDVTNRTEAAMALRELRPPDPAPSLAAVPGFGERPAIAVLPFDDLGGDPSERAFCDGLVEDLTTHLAAWRWFPVIARNSAFAVAGRGRTVREICRELGARYLIEGSARRAGDRIRINVQVIDGEKDAHVFAEKYDRGTRNLFAVQDDIVTAIVGVLEPTLLRVEGVRALRKSSTELDAWDHCQRGIAVLHQQEHDYAARSLPHFDAALALDPEFAPAHAGRSLAQFALGLAQVGSTHEGAEGTLEQAFARAAGCFQDALAAGRRAVALDPLDPAGHIGLGSGLAMTGQLAAATAAFERALELNPSSAQACFALASSLTVGERADEAPLLLERAIRLSPFDPARQHFEGALGAAHFAAGRDEAALLHTQRSLEFEREGAMSYLPLLPACHAHLGRLDEARAAIDAVRERWPDWNLGLFQITAPPAMTERLIEGYRRAGWDLAPD